MRNLRIAYAEDNKAWQCHVLRELRRLGHAVGIYEQPEDLLVRLRRDPKQDLIIIAGQMKRMSGVEVLRQIRKDPRLLDLKVIVHTGLDTSKREIRRLKGIYVFKGDNFQNLLDAVAEVAAEETAE